MDPVLPHGLLLERGNKTTKTMASDFVIEADDVH
jgi:hypothetical protein